MNEIEGGITAALGYQAAGVHCGIKLGKKDLCLIVSDCPAATAGMFTQNKLAAAPVVFDRVQLKKSHYMSAIVANSGIANACTGERGLQDCQTIAAKAAAVLSIPSKHVLVASTGVIGPYLLIDKITQGIELAASHLSRANHLDAEIAIMTTDTRPKEYALEVESEAGTFRIGGMAKGSGMIKPDMATMLAFLTTDAKIAPEPLEIALQQAVRQSFNRISVDNDTSTNDTVLLLANGKAGGQEIVPGSGAYTQFCDALNAVCIHLAKMLVKDGEGTTKLIEIQVQNAASPEDALTGARAIADSYLVKTAIHGEDPNWGRITAALGYAGIELVPEYITLAINGLPILARNFQLVSEKVNTRKALAPDEIVITVDLGVGSHACTVWTSDLSCEYVDINAKYTT
ncbi:bifunctional glutamate N-acetyltransferase/amino-acid acetyltransferase ArgJ [candidate division KSB3 bacterium]|uniref:Arginine biosynthesis bifunctional protein ArgJ n=1 Tax=candidate division KSB3 bacterium TaxID=2044937 RepID=A0A9D5JX01_9BACT|nr:bifunctional glutamate N-acetyltransferase/amino-acid acetyltransferase ArgJ [candidate division KSB3 bacterium]MBD3325675.1 bifunctional glutamate N-acetyltransferase/amino-acid acetyltransferase ArgJ [candidate division KSB3 bacterium]